MAKLTGVQVRHRLILVEGTGSHSFRVTEALRLSGYEVVTDKPETRRVDAVVLACASEMLVERVRLTRGHWGGGAPNARGFA
jgi:hypothetical protein